MLSVKIDDIFKTRMINKDFKTRRRTSYFQYLQWGCLIFLRFRVLTVHEWEKMVSSQLYPKLSFFQIKESWIYNNSNFNSSSVNIRGSSNLEKQYLRDILTWCPHWRPEGRKLIEFIYSRITIITFQKKIVWSIIEL